MTYRVKIEPVSESMIDNSSGLVPGTGDWQKGVDGPVSIVVKLDPVIRLPALLGLLVAIKQNKNVSGVYDAVVIVGPT